MGHCTDLSKEVQGSGPKLNKKFQLVFLLWSLLFRTVATLDLLVCIYTVSCKFVPRVSERDIDHQWVFTVEADRNISVSYFSLAFSRSSLVTKCQNDGRTPLPFSGMSVLIWMGGHSMLLLGMAAYRKLHPSYAG